MSIQAYQRAATQAESPREIEYRAFGKATAGLMRAKEEGRANLGGLAIALEENRRLWSVMAADCALDTNELPQQTRAAIVTLGLFVLRYTSQVLRGEADIDLLIEVNRDVMEGLAPKAIAAGP
jgi:flagellar biosynthesis activator protein FlaF